MELNEKKLLEYGFELNLRDSDKYWKSYELKVNGGKLQVKLNRREKASGSHLWITFSGFYYQKFWLIKDTSEAIPDIEKRLEHYEDVYFLTRDEKTEKRIEYVKKTLELLASFDK